MRTLPPTLLAEQIKSTYTPVVKATLTRELVSHTYSTPRILNLSHREAPFRQSADLLLDNSDGALTALDLQGFRTTMGYGFITPLGEELSDTPPLWVTAQELYSAKGKLTAELKLIGIPDLLALDRASESFIPLSTDTRSIKTLLTEMITASAPCFSHCVGYALTWGTLDGFINTFQPKDGFRIYTNGSRLAAIKRLLGYTHYVMRFTPAGGIHIFKPTISGATFDYEYTLDSGHTFFSKAYRKTLVLPNFIRVESHPDDDPGFSGFAQDAESIAAFGEVRRFVRTRLSSGAEATAIAEAIIGKERLNAEKGSADVPMNVGQEVYDFIKVTDTRAGDSRTGNVGSIRRRYKGGSFDMRFALGRVDLALGEAITRDALIKDALAEEPTPIVTRDTIAIQFIIDGGGAAITPGSKGYLKIPFKCIVDAWTLFGDLHGAIVIDVRVCSFTDFPTTTSIAGTEKPTLDPLLGTRPRRQNWSLETWTHVIRVPWNILEFVVDSADTVTRVSLMLRARLV